ncbi:MAG: NAD(P)-binding protein [Rhodoblastus sp.]
MLAHDALVIGAGPGGLAAAQQLRANGLAPLVIETAGRVGELLPDAPDVLDAEGRPKISDGPTAAPGLYFVGAMLVATGQLRQIAIGAKVIARDSRRLLYLQGAQSNVERLFASQ